MHNHLHRDLHDYASIARLHVCLAYWDTISMVYMKAKMKETAEKKNVPRFPEAAPLRTNGQYLSHSFPDKCQDRIISWVWAEKGCFTSDLYWSRMIKFMLQSGYRSRRTFA